MNCIAIDDDLLALNTISEFCKKISYINLSGSFTNPMDAVNLLNSNEIDLIFIDIHMLQIEGIDFLKSLYNPPLIIFTTTSKEYAFQAFESDAVDFLLKPFEFNRFVRSLNKAQQLVRLRTICYTSDEDNMAYPFGFIMVKVEYTTIRVNLNDILYIEGLRDYIKIYSGGKPILTKTTMKNAIEKLPHTRFIRVHKSYIVSVEKIDMIENSRIVIGKQRIPVGESFKAPFFNMISRNSI
jgi:DNA-binding LytR/AlgR family response regulator